MVVAFLALEDLMALETQSLQLVEWRLEVVVNWSWEDLAWKCLPLLLMAVLVDRTSATLLH